MLTLLSSGQGQSGTYVELMLQAYKLRVYAEAGVFEAEECLKASLNTLNNYQVDPNAQLVRNYATRVRANGGTVEAFDSTISRIKDLRNQDLYDKASLTLLPSGVKSGTIFSLQPESILDNDLIVNGNFSQNETNWTKTEPFNSAVTFTNNQLTFNRPLNSSDPSVRNIGTGIKGKTYKITFEVVSATLLSNNVGVSIGGNTVYLSPSISSVGIKEIIITASETSPITIHHGGGGPSVIVLDNISAKEYLSADLSFNRNTTKTRTNGAGLIETVAANVPSLNYDSVGGEPSVLLEPQRTNKLIYSNNVVNNSWVQGALYGTINYGISPEGTQNSNRILFTDISQAIYQQYNGTLGEVNTFSCWIKGIYGQTIEIGQFNAFSLHTFNGEWQYFQSTKTTSVNLTVQFTTYGGATARDFEFYGTQVEVAPYATSYIPTLASTVTRNQDLISKTGISDLINSEEITFFVEAKTSTNGGINRAISLSDGTTNNRISITFHLTAKRIQVISVKAGLILFSFEITTVTQDNFNKIAITLNNSSAKLFVNGVLIQESTIALSYAAGTLNKFSFDVGQTNILPFDGECKTLQLYKTSLTDAECVTLTS
jgi:hypothetical protein